MLLDSKKLAVEQAWLQRCDAQSRLDLIADKCDMECREYFSRPAALLWPFAAGVLITRFKRAAPATLEVTSLALSALKVAGKASPFVRRLLS